MTMRIIAPSSADAKHITAFMAAYGATASWNGGTYRLKVDGSAALLRLALARVNALGWACSCPAAVRLRSATVDPSLTPH